MLTAAAAVDRAGRLVAEFFEDLVRLDDEPGRRAVVADLLSDISSTDLRERVRLRVANLQHDLISTRALESAVVETRSRHRVLRRSTVRRAICPPGISERQRLHDRYTRHVRRRAQRRRDYLASRRRALQLADALRHALHRHLASIRALTLAVEADPRNIEYDPAHETAVDRLRNVLRIMTDARRTAHLWLPELDRQLGHGLTRSTSKRVARSAVTHAVRSRRELDESTVTLPHLVFRLAARLFTDRVARNRAGARGLRRDLTRALREAYRLLDELDPIEPHLTDPAGRPRPKPCPTARRLMRLAVARLPIEWRDRYARETYAELTDLARTGATRLRQIRHGLAVLRHAPAQRKQLFPDL